MRNNEGNMAITVLLAIMLSFVLIQSCDNSESQDGHHNQHHHGHEDHDHNQQYDNQQDLQDPQEHTQQQQQFTHDHSNVQHQSSQPSHTQFKMIQSQPHLIQSLKLTPISIFFYGQVNSPQYQQFQNVLPTYNSQFLKKLSTQVQFYFIPSEKFTLSRPRNSLSIYRKINNGEWLMYKGRFQKNQIINWILKNTIDPLQELTGQQIDSLFADSKKGFILLDFGQFYLLKTKIMINDFCKKYDLFCGKITHRNKALSMTIQLMRAQKQPGVPKLGFWNPKTQQLQIYTKDPGQITQNELMQLYSGHESVIPYETQLDVAEAIHPQTQFIQIKQHKQNIEL